MPAAPLTAIIVNRQSGTVRSMGEDAVRSLVTKAFPEAGLALVDGSEIDGRIRAVVTEGKAARLIVGGGDGTLAGAAGLVAGTHIALGIIPLGTLNMMAQTIGMAADPAAALDQLREADEKVIDAARANGRLFLHHVSFGLQPRIVRIREHLGYSSRFTKLLAGTRAFFAVMLNPQSMRLRMEVDGTTLDMKTPVLIISNNVYADTMMLKQARLDEGVLGLYALAPMPLLSYLGLAFDMLRGRWRDSPNVKEMRPKRATILARRLFGRNQRGISATLDGEQVLFDLPLVIETQPAALTLLVPRAGGT